MGEVAGEDKSVKVVDFTVAVDIGGGFDYALFKSLGPFCEPARKKKTVVVVYNAIAVHIAEKDIGNIDGPVLCCKCNFFSVDVVNVEITVIVRNGYRGLAERSIFKNFESKDRDISVYGEVLGSGVVYPTQLVRRSEGRGVNLLT